MQCQQYDVNWPLQKGRGRFHIMDCGANAIAPRSRKRTRESIGAVRHVFLEADRDGPVVLARIAARSDLPAPSYVLHSSPNRVHVFWRVTGFTAEQVEALQSGSRTSSRRIQPRRRRADRRGF
jgi:hypothetical protein